MLPLDSSHSFGMTSLGVLQKKFGYSGQLRRKIKMNKEFHITGFVCGERFSQSYLNGLGKGMYLNA